MNSQYVTSPSGRILLAFLVAVSALSSPQTTRAVPPPQFGARAGFPIGGSPYSMAIADFNRDAKLDIALLQYPGGVELLLGLGNGTFAPQINSNLLFRGNSLAAGDFNNDGNPDLLTYGDYGGSVLLGDGSGHFPAVTNSVYTYYPGGLAVGDFNGDGKLDFASRESQGILVALGRGDGSFGSRINYNVTNSPCDYRAGDIEGNGRLDLVVALRGYGPTNSSCFCTLAGKGDGTFAAPQYYLGALRADQRSLELADLNCDGSLDLAIANLNAGSVTIRLNNGTGAFGPPTDYSVGLAPSGLVAGEFNGDGDMDLLVRGGPVAVVLSGHGDGSFTVSAPMSFSSEYWARPTLGVGDFNGDGMPDLALLDYSGGAVTVMLNQTPPLLWLTPMPGYTQLSWLTTFGAGYTLEYTTNLAQPVTWHPFPYPPVVLGNQKAVTDWTDSGTKFYRLRKPW